MAARNGERLIVENVKMECDLVFEDEQSPSFIPRVFERYFKPSFQKAQTLARFFSGI